MIFPKNSSFDEFNHISQIVNKCYICNKNIPDGNPKEHIILNALGGNLTSKFLICNFCNNSFSNIDAALSQSLNPFGVLLNIERDDRKTNPRIKATITDTDEKIYIDLGGKPVLPEAKPEITDNSIQFNTEVQLKKYLVKNCRFSKSQAEEILKNDVVRRQEYIFSVTIKTPLFGDKQFRSLCKMAINFYMYHGGKRDLIAHLIPYIKGEDKNQYISYYYPNENIPESTSNLTESFIHTLFIKGNPKEKILYGYIELYNSFKVIVLLSDFYEGDFFQKIYSFDVFTRKEIEKEIDINLSKEEILNLLKSSEKPVKEISIAINDLVESIRLNHLNKHIEDVLNKFKEEENCDKKMSRKLIAEELSKQITDFMPKPEDF